MDNDEIYLTIRAAVNWAGVNNLVIRPDYWGVDGTDENGDWLEKWQAYEDHVCPLGATLLQRQPDPEESGVDVVSAIAYQFDVPIEWVDGFVAGFDGKFPRQAYWHESTEAITAGYQLGQRFRQELGYA